MIEFKLYMKDGTVMYIECTERMKHKMMQFFDNESDIEWVEEM